MNAREPRRRATIAAAVALAGLMAPASASAAGSTLTLGVQGPAVQGQVTTIVASGTNSDPQSGSNYLFIYSKDPRVDPTCAPTQEQESQTFFNNVFEPATAGAYDSLATGQLESYGPGSFNIQIKKVFGKPGPRLLCAYSTYIAVTTVATQLTVNVAPAGGGDDVTTTKPANRSRPRVSRRGSRLTCSRGTWRDAKTYKYSWTVNNKVKRGARSRSLKISRSVRGSVKCRVTAANAAGRTMAVSRAYRVR